MRYRPMRSGRATGLDAPGFIYAVCLILGPILHAAVTLTSLEIGGHPCALHSLWCTEPQQAQSVVQHQTGGFDHGEATLTITVRHAVFEDWTC